MTDDWKPNGWDRLNLEEKLDYAGRLWDSIVTEVPPGSLLSDAQREETAATYGYADRPIPTITWRGRMSSRPL